MAERSDQGGSAEREPQGTQGQQQSVTGGAAPAADQERPMEVSRENEPRGVQAGESGGGQQQQQTQRMQPGMQRAGAMAQRSPQPSVLPAFMANPGLMASAFMANPFEFAQLMSNEMDRLFENFGMGAAGFGGALSPAGGRAQQQQPQQGGAQRGTQRGTSMLGPRAGQRGLGSFTPQMEVLQRGNELVLRADLPGLRPDDVNVEIDDGVLTISGERREEVDDRREGFYHSERRYGSFYRAVPLPEGVSEEQINASFRDGVLEVTVPLPQQQPQQRARRIPIQGASGGAPATGGTAASWDAGTSEG